MESLEHTSQLFYTEVIQGKKEFILPEEGISHNPRQNRNSKENRNKNRNRNRNKE